MRIAFFRTNPVYGALEGGIEADCRPQGDPLFSRRRSLRDLARVKLLSRYEVVKIGRYDSGRRAPRAAVFLKANTSIGPDDPIAIRSDEVAFEGELAIVIKSLAGGGGRESTSPANETR